MIDFSVIIPFYNAKKTLNRAVSSVINQTYINWELVLVNDGSSDDSINSLNKNFLIDRRIKFITQENSGVSTSRNKGANLASGNWLIFLDADDELVEDALENFKFFIETNVEQFRIIKAGYKKVKKDLSKVFNNSETEFHSFLSGSFVIRKELFVTLGGYDIHLKFSENAELCHRFSIFNEPLGYLGFVVLVYHESVSGGSKNSQNIVYSLTYFLDKHRDTLSPHVKHLYHQIIGVNYLRLKKMEHARAHLAWSIFFKPWKLSTLGRLMIACCPPLACKLYSVTVKNG